MPSPDQPSNPSTPNPIKQRDPELVKRLASFQSRLGTILLDSLAPLLADPGFRTRHAPDFLADIHAAAQILRILVQDEWTEHDLDTFDTYWRDACRSDLFAEEFEAERHRIQACVEIARTKLLERETTTARTTTKPQKMTQGTLW